MPDGETRTQRRRRQTHEALLDALFDLSVDNGLNEVTVHDVVEQADVAVGTFYNHFESREEAIAELVNHLMAGGRRDVDRFTPGADDAALALGKVVASVSSAITEEPRWTGFMSQIANSSHWPMGSMYRDVARLIDAGIEAGDLSGEGSSEQRALLIGAQLRAALALATSPIGPLDPGLLASTCLAVAGATPATTARVLTALELTV